MSSLHPISKKISTSAISLEESKAKANNSLDSSDTGKANLHNNISSAIWWYRKAKILMISGTVLGMILGMLITLNSGFAMAEASGEYYWAAFFILSVWLTLPGFVILVSAFINAMVNDIVLRSTVENMKSGTVMLNELLGMLGALCLTMAMPLTNILEEDACHGDLDKWGQFNCDAQSYFSLSATALFFFSVTLTLINVAVVLNLHPNEVAYFLISRKFLLYFLPFVNILCGCFFVTGSYWYHTENIYYVIHGEHSLGSAGPPLYAIASANTMWLVLMYCLLFLAEAVFFMKRAEYSADSQQAEFGVVRRTFEDIKHILTTYVAEQPDANFMHITEAEFMRRVSADESGNVGYLHEMSEKVARKMLNSYVDKQIDTQLDDKIFKM